MKTLKQLIQELNWFDFLRKIKEILFKVSDSPLNSKIQAGSNITLEGEGTEESPLKINSTGGGSGGSQDLQSVLNEGSFANISEFSLNMNNGGAISADQESPLTIQGRTNGISLQGQTGSVAISSGNIISLQASNRINIVVPPLVDNTVTRGLSRDNSGRLVEFDLGVSGTFTAPTSITVVNGIITAIS